MLALRRLRVPFRLTSLKPFHLPTQTRSFAYENNFLKKGFSFKGQGNNSFGENLLKKADAESLSQTKETNVDNVEESTNLDVVFSSLIGDEKSFFTPEEMLPPKEEDQDLEPAESERLTKDECELCEEENEFIIDAMNVPFLLKYMNHFGRIVSRHNTGTCSKHQRQVTAAIRKARHMGLFSYKGGLFQVEAPFLEEDEKLSTWDEEEEMENDEELEDEELEDAATPLIELMPKGPKKVDIESAKLEEFEDYLFELRDEGYEDLLTLKHEANSLIDEEIKPNLDPNDVQPLKNKLMKMIDEVFERVEEGEEGYEDYEDEEENDRF